MIKVLTWLSHFCKVEKCDNKVNTSCCHIFVAYREKNVMTSQNVEMADAKGSHH